MIYYLSETMPPLNNISVRLRRLLLMAAPVAGLLLFISLFAYFVYKTGIDELDVGGPSIYINDSPGGNLTAASSRESGRNGAGKASSLPGKSGRGGVLEDRGTGAAAKNAGKRKSGAPSGGEGPFSYEEGALPSRGSGSPGAPASGRGESFSSEGSFPAGKGSSFPAAGTPKTLMPSTMEEASSIFPESKRDTPPIEVDGSVAYDMFVISVYNSLAGGSLFRDGNFLLKPRGEPLADRISVELDMPPGTKEREIQMPVVLNGAVVPSDTEAPDVSINKYGVARFSRRISSARRIRYTIKRTSRNSSLSASFPVSKWLMKEFNSIPEEIRVFLDASRNGPCEYRMLFVSAIFNKCFGYQKNVLPVRLTGGMTWGEYLSRSVSNNLRFMCDCDVLSTYAFIFTRYLGIKSVVAVGYLNGPESPDSLRAEELHAVTLVNLDDEWLIFDPSYITPDVSAKAAALTGKRPVPAMGSAESGESGKAYPSAPSEMAAKRFTVPKGVMNLLGVDLFGKDVAGEYDSIRTISIPSLLDLRSDFKGTLSLYSSIPYMRKWGLRIIMALAAALILSALAACSAMIRSGAAAPKGLLYAARFDSVFFALTALAWARGFIKSSGPAGVPGWAMFLGLFLALFGTGIGISAYAASAYHYLKRKSGIFIHEGIYKFSRNPAYAAYALMGAGLSVYAWDAITAVISALAVIAGNMIVGRKESDKSASGNQDWKKYRESVPKYL